MSSSIYTIKSIVAPFQCNGKFNCCIWKNVKPVKIDNYMGQQPEHRPSVQAKMAYDSNNIYVIFQVEDNYIRATRIENQLDIWNDSCVEFFFSDNIKKGYLAIEMNCGGSFLLYYKSNPQSENVLFTQEQCQQVEVYHSMSKKIEPELQIPTVWTVEYRLPLNICKEYLDITTPSPGVCWYGNFYKCADESSKPHWLTWSEIDWPVPNFHKPEFFGKIVFA